MGINEGFEKTMKLPEIWNDTELSLEELDKITWEKVERSLLLESVPLLILTQRTLL